jgi:hypothetical protein
MDPNLHHDTDGSTEECTDCHRWQDYASWYLQSKGYRRQEESKDGSKNEQKYVADRGRSRLTQSELIIQDFGALGE